MDTYKHTVKSNTAKLRVRDNNLYMGRAARSKGPLKPKTIAIVTLVKHKIKEGTSCEYQICDSPLSFFPN